MKHALRLFSLLLLIGGTSAATAQSPETVDIRGYIRGGQVSFTVEDLAALPQTTFTTPLYSDYPQWPDTEIDATFSGVLFSDLLDRLGATGQTATVVAADGYTFPIDLDDLRTYGAMLAIEQDGALLAGTDRGPAWIVYPLADHPEIMGPDNRDKWVWAVVDITIH